MPNNEKKYVYFMSDAHLGARYVTDSQAHERRVVSFLDSIKGKCAALYLLGDMLDYWYEYSNLVPKGHVRFLGKLAELSDSGIKIYWMLGNHEVMLGDEMLNEIGMTVLDGKCVRTVMGKKFLLSHGDDVAEPRSSYKFMKWCFRSGLCRWLFELIHPVFATKVGTGWSKSNRQRRVVSAEDIARVKQYAITGLEKDVAAGCEFDYAVFGHLHSQGEAVLSNGARVLMLGEWISGSSYVEFDGQEANLKKFNFTAND